MNLSLRVFLPLLVYLFSHFFLEMSVSSTFQTISISISVLAYLLIIIISVHGSVDCGVTNEGLVRTRIPSGYLIRPTRSSKEFDLDKGMRDIALICERFIFKPLIFNS